MCVFYNIYIYKVNMYRIYVPFSSRKFRFDFNTTRILDFVIKSS